MENISACEMKGAHDVFVLVSEGRFSLLWKKGFDNRRLSGLY